MKKKLLSLTGALLLISVCFVGASSVFAAQEKIAYMDLGKIFDEYNKTKDLDKQLENKGDAKQVERDRLVAEIKKLKDELDVMSEKGREAKQSAIDDKIKKLQDFDRDSRDELRKERDDMVRLVLKEIKDIIDEIGKKEGYLFILDSRAILYGKEGDDMTNSILKILNDKYATTATAKGKK